MLRLLVATLAAAVVLGLAPFSVEAHSGKQTYLYVSVFDDGVEGRVEIPAADLGRALGTEIPGRLAELRAAAAALTEPTIDYVQAHLSFAGDDGPWGIDFGERLRILPTENGPYVVLPFEIDEEFDSAPGAFTVDLSVIIEFDPEKDALLLIEDDWASATFDNGSETLLGFSTGRTEQRVELGGASTLDSVLAIRGIGTDAVRTGIDALLIVVGVVTAAVMIPAAHRRRVVPAAAVGRRLRTGLLALVAGHSITLWIIGLGVLTPSVRLSGILTAVGLGLIAGFVVFGWWRPGVWAGATAVIVAVGALQGFALAAVFDAQGLDRRRPFTSLLAFHLGVEVAVAILVVLVAAPLWLLRRTRVSPIVTLGLGAALAGYAVGWFLERLVDDDWPIEEVANPLRVWPRNLVFVVLAIAIAAAIRQFDARTGRLRDIDDLDAGEGRPPTIDRPDLEVTSR